MAAATAAWRLDSSDGSVLLLHMSSMLVSTCQNRVQSLQVGKDEDGSSGRQRRAVVRNGGTSCH